MNRRVGALVVAGVAGLSALGLAAALPASSASAGPSPTVDLGTTVVVPGQAVTVTGASWPDQTRVQAALCGDDAVGGTVDCADGSTAAMAATTRGLLWGQITGTVPPAPCPCVVLVTADSLGYRRTIAVTVEGASSARVSSPAVAAPPTVGIASLQVRGTVTAFSAMGASIRRTVELRLTNPTTAPVTPVLLGSWGRGPDPTSTIRFPEQGPLAAGKSRTVEGSFEVAAFSVGTFTVKVRAQLVGYPHAAAAVTTFGQWPFGLLALAAVFLLVILTLPARRWGRRRARRRDQLRRARAAAAAPDGPRGGPTGGAGRRTGRGFVPPLTLTALSDVVG